MKVTCPACGERQDDSGRTTFTCSHCGKSLSTIRRADAMASTDAAGVAATPFGATAGGWLGLGAVMHVIGVVVIVVSLTRHDEFGDRTTNLAGTVSGAIVAWLGFLLLVVGLAAYAVEIVSARLTSMSGA
jgi:hypothetical protein